MVGRVGGWGLCSGGHCTKQARVKYRAKPLLEHMNNVAEGNAASCRRIPVANRQLTYSGELEPKYLFQRNPKRFWQQLLPSRVFIQVHTNPKLQW